MKLTGEEKFNAELGSARGVVIFLTADSKIDVERPRAEIMQDFAELDGWSSAASNLKERMKEEQTA